jgi:hypothetical protein
MRSMKFSLVLLAGLTVAPPASGGVPVPTRSWCQVATDLVLEAGAPAWLETWLRQRCGNPSVKTNGAGTDALGVSAPV